MFVQVIQGRTSQPQAVAEAFDRWRADLAPGATGWLGSTGGVTEDGRFLGVARFESEEAAAANSQRPEQDAWWSETASCSTGKPHSATAPTYRRPAAATRTGPDSSRSCRAGAATPSVPRQLMTQDSDKWAEFRPDVIGSVAIGHDEGAYTMVLYFTSEAEAREGERKEPPPELQAQMEEMNKLTVGEPEFFDLKQPFLASPG